jgi:hypothetical protein
MKVAAPERSPHARSAIEVPILAAQVRSRGRLRAAL